MWNNVFEIGVETNTDQIFIIDNRAEKSIASATEIRAIFSCKFLRMVTSKARK